MIHLKDRDTDACLPLAHGFIACAVTMPVLSTLLPVISSPLLLLIFIRFPISAAICSMRNLHSIQMYDLYHHTHHSSFCMNKVTFTIHLHYIIFLFSLFHFLSYDATLVI